MVGLYIQKLGTKGQMVSTKNCLPKEQKQSGGEKDIFGNLS